MSDQLPSSLGADDPVVGELVVEPDLAADEEAVSVLVTAVEQARGVQSETRGRRPIGTAPAAADAAADMKPVQLNTGTTGGAL